MAKKGKYVYEWPRPMVTVDAVVFCRQASFRGPDKGKTKVLLIQRGKEPFKGMWALPGGFVEMDEELEDAAARELAEETGLKGVRLEQMHTFGTVGRDPRGRQISVVFTGMITVKSKRPKVKGRDDAAKAKWFDLRKLPRELAFDHSEIIRFAAKKLKEKK